MLSRFRILLVTTGMTVALAGADLRLSSAQETQRSGDESASAPLEQLELRAVVSLPGATLFSLHDRTLERAFWIDDAQSRYGIQVESFDAERNLLVLRHGTATRELALQRTRILERDEEELTERERLEQRWAAREEERERFGPRWEAALEDSPELRELTEHFREVIGEFRELREGLESADGDSEKEALIRERQRAIAAEYRLIEDLGLNLVSVHPAFEHEDRETLEILLGLVRQSWPEAGME